MEIDKREREANCCSNCQFWFVIGERQEPINECRANPPRGGNMPRTIGTWPLTKASMWCGKHKRIKEKNSAGT